MAPETASVAPAIIPTNTRGSRRFQTTTLRVPISGSSPPRRNAFHAFRLNTTPGSNTVRHASPTVIEYVPKLTCASPPATVSATQPRQNRASVRLYHPRSVSVGERAATASEPPMSV
jgi:hypothetical protein